MALALPMTHSSTTMTTTTTLSDEDLASSSKGVHFNEECILIPESQLNASKRPRIVTKSYSLPIWKKKLPDGASSDTELEAEESRVVFKVPLPSISLKHHSISPSAEAKPLAPCLVNRSPEVHHRSVSDSLPSSHPGRQLVREMAKSSPRSISRSPSAPRASPRSLPRSDCISVPLRKCCPGCLLVTEASLKEGEKWETKFTRGAQRKRSASVDSAEPGTGASFASVTVDEVSKHHHHHGHSDALVERLHVAMAEGEHSVLSALPASLSRITARPPSRIAEEDESQLFPLPSPKRSPNASPLAGTPTSSTTSLPLKNGSKESLSHINRRPNNLLSPPPPSPLSNNPSASDDGSPRPFPTVCPSSWVEQPLAKFNANNLYAKPQRQPALSVSEGSRSPMTAAALSRSRSYDQITSGMSPTARRPPPRPSPVRRPSLQKQSSSFLKAGVSVLKGVTAIGGVSV